MQTIYPIEQWMMNNNWLLITIIVVLAALILWYIWYFDVLVPAGE